MTKHRIKETARAADTIDMVRNPDGVWEQDTGQHMTGENPTYIIFDDVTDIPWFGKKDKKK